MVASGASDLFNSVHSYRFEPCLSKGVLLAQVRLATDHFATASREAHDTLSL